MNEKSASRQEAERGKIIPTAASELNNLIQVISGTVEMLEKIWEGPPQSVKYFETLRASLERGAKVTAQLVQHAGGTNQRIRLHPDLVPSANGKPAPTKPVKNQPCILVVDDEPMALALSRYVLAQAGFAVVTAQSGPEALELFGKEPGRFTLILMDLSMPLMDGEETFIRLRAIDPKALVVLDTGFIEKHRLDRMMAAGLDGFLRRPYQPDELLRQIQSVIEGGRNRVSVASPSSAAAFS